jgi:spore maturation protein CgeB
VLRSDAEFVVLLDSKIRVSKNWLNELVTEIKSRKEAVIEPILQLVNGEIYRQQAFICRSKESVSIKYINSEEPELIKADLFQGLCVLMQRTNFIAQGGLNPLLVNQYLDLDLSSKFAKQSIELKDSKLTYYPDLSISKNLQIEENNLWVLNNFYQNFLLKVPEILSEDPKFSTSKTTSTRKSALKTIAIKVSVPNQQVQHLWGDYHFANSLAKALSSYGYNCRIDLAIDWHKNEVNQNEINLLLRGISDYQIDQNQINIVWLISHPNLVDLKKLQEFNHIFVASNFYVNYLNEQLGNKVSLLLQASDSSIFYPDLSDESYEDKLLFVGNSRNQYRRIVEQILIAKLNLDVHGSGWEQFIPKDFIKSSYIENTELGKYYRKANLIINDHWQDMRDLGFISNRIFDALASAVPVLTDQIIGLPEEFKAYVKILNTELSDPEQIRHLVNEILNKSKGNRDQRIELAKLIHKEHSFEHRAQAIISVIEKL